MAENQPLTEKTQVRNFSVANIRKLARDIKSGYMVPCTLVLRVDGHIVRKATADASLDGPICEIKTTDGSKIVADTVMDTVILESVRA